MSTKIERDRMEPTCSIEETRPLEEVLRSRVGLDWCRRQQLLDGSFCYQFD